MEKNQIISAIKNLKADYLTKVTDFVKANMSSEWQVTYFAENVVNIGFVTGKWSNGTDKYTEIEVRYGNEWSYVNGFENAEKVFRFDINPFTGGSFNPLEKSELHTYFSGVGFICNNTDFTLALHDILYDFTMKVEVYRKQLDVIIKEEERIKREQEEQEREAKELADYTEKSEQLKNLNPSDDLYVVIKKGEGGKFIYRKQEITLVSSPITYQEANRMKHNIERGYVPCNIKYQVVEASKIKF